MFSYEWNFRIFYPFVGALFRGLLVTVELFVLSTVLSTIIGVALALLLRRLPPRWRFVPLRGIGFFANDIVRAIPILVLLYLFYYFPGIPRLGMAPLGEFWASVWALTVSQAVFTADLVYNAMDRVNRRTVLAAHALALDERTIFFSFVAPDVIRQISPAMISFWIGLLKLTSFASVIGCPDLVYVASVIGSQQFRTLEVWVVIACVYMILVVPATLVERAVENSEWIRRR